MWVVRGTGYWKEAYLRSTPLHCIWGALSLVILLPVAFCCSFVGGALAFHICPGRPLHNLSPVLSFQKIIPGCAPKCLDSDVGISLSPSAEAHGVPRDLPGSLGAPGGHRYANLAAGPLETVLYAKGRPGGGGGVGPKKKTAAQQQQQKLQQQHGGGFAKHRKALKAAEKAAASAKPPAGPIFNTPIKVARRAPAARADAGDISGANLQARDLPNELVNICCLSKTYNAKTYTRDYRPTAMFYRCCEKGDCKFEYMKDMF